MLEQSVTFKTLSEVKVGSREFDFDGFHEGWSKSDQRMLGQAAYESGVDIAFETASRLGYDGAPVLIDTAIIGKDLMLPNRYQWDNALLYRVTMFGGSHAQREQNFRQFHARIQEIHDAKQSVLRSEWEDTIGFIRSMVPDGENLRISPREYDAFIRLHNLDKGAAMDLRCFLMGETPLNTPKSVTFERWLKTLWEQAPEFYATYSNRKRMYELKKEFKDKPFFAHKMINNNPEQWFSDSCLAPVYKSGIPLTFSMNRYRPYVLPELAHGVAFVIHTSGTKNMISRQAGVFTGRFLLPNGVVVLQFQTFNPNVHATVFHVPESEVLEIGILKDPLRDISNFVKPLWSHAQENDVAALKPFPPGMQPDFSVMLVPKLIPKFSIY